MGRSRVWNQATWVRNHNAPPTPRTLPNRPETYPGDSSDTQGREALEITPWDLVWDTNQLDTDHQCENREDTIFISKCRNGVIGPGFRWCTKKIIKQTGTAAE